MCAAVVYVWCGGGGGVYVVGGSRLKPASDDKISKVNGILSDGVYSSSFAKDRTQQNTFALHERLKNWTAEA